MQNYVYYLEGNDIIRIYINYNLLLNRKILPNWRINMYKRNKHKKTNIMELLVCSISIGCLYYALLQTPLKLWEITLIMLAVLSIILTSQLLVFYIFKQHITRKAH